MAKKNFLSAWKKILRLISGIVVLCTFIMIPISLVYTIYYLIHYDFGRIVVGCLLIFSMTHLNLKMTGGK